MERLAHRLGPRSTLAPARNIDWGSLSRFVDQVPGRDQAFPDAELDRDPRAIAHRAAAAPDVLKLGVDEHPARGPLDLDWHIPPHQVIEDLPRPLCRRDAAAVNGSLGADLDLGVDELADRRPVARAEGGQDAASEFVRVRTSDRAGCG
jgi:hypothetical protein